MAWKTVLAGAVSAVFLQGCAGALSLLTDPAIDSDKLDEQGELSKLKGVTGDRRLVRVVADGQRPRDQWVRPNEPLYYFDLCAETQADAIVTRGSSSSLNVTGQGSASDATSQLALLTYQRGVVSDVARQFSWQLCNARLNGDLTREEYRDALLSLQRHTLTVLQQMALEDGSTTLALEPAVPNPRTAGAAAPALPPPPAEAPK